MDSQIFRKKSLELLESPEELNDYVRVTRPSTWMILGAAVILMAGLLIWAVSASFVSVVSGKAIVKDGMMTVSFDDSTASAEVKAGMVVELDDLEIPILTVGTDAEGKVTASGEASGIADGEYPAEVTYKKTQVLDLLFSNS